MASHSNVIAFPGSYAQPGPYEYDNRTFTPEDMDEYDAVVARALRHGTPMAGAPGAADPEPVPFRWLAAA